MRDLGLLILVPLLLLLGGCTPRAHLGDSAGKSLKAVQEVQRASLEQGKSPAPAPLGSQEVLRINERYLTSFSPPSQGGGSTSIGGGANPAFDFASLMGGGAGGGGGEKQITLSGE